MGLRCMALLRCPSSRCVQPDCFMHKPLFSFNMTAWLFCWPLLSDFPQLIARTTSWEIQLNVFAIQEQFLQLWQQDPDSAAYNSPWGLRLEGHLDIPSLQAAVHLLAKRHLVRWSKQLAVTDSFNFIDVNHEMSSIGKHGTSSCSVHTKLISLMPLRLCPQVLRSRFCPADGQDGLRQAILPVDAVALSVSEIHTNGKPLLQQVEESTYSVTKETSLHKAWRAFAAAPFDLYIGPLVRMQV